MLIQGSIVIESGFVTAGPARSLVFFGRSGGEDLGEEFLLRLGRVPGMDRADAGEQHFRAMRRADNDFDTGEVAFATVQIHRQTIERFGVAGGCRVGQGYLLHAWFYVE